MKQIGLALHLYHDTYKSLPPGWIGLETPGGRPFAEGGPGWGWASMLLPFLEQENVADSLLTYELPILHADNDAGKLTHLAGYRCPSDVGDERFNLEVAGGGAVLTPLARANYVGVFGVSEIDDCVGLAPGVICRGEGAFWHVSSTRFAHFIDGISNTIIVGERATRLGDSTWVGAVRGGDESIARILGIADHAPNEVGGHLDDFSSQHPAGANFLLGDGSVRIITDTIDLEVYRAISTIAGGEPRVLSN